MAETIALLGGGKMGEALLGGLQRAGHTVVVVEKSRDRGAYLTQRYGVDVLDGPSAVGQASVVLLATKPHDVVALLRGLGDAVTAQHLLVSVAAGITAATMEAALPEGTPVVRCMPNTPALVGEGMTAIAPGAGAGEAHLDLAASLLAGVGRVVRVTEAQLDAVTALSGSGPAYFFAVVEALVDAGVLLGLPRPLATELVVQTAVGSAAMLRDSGDSATGLREAVTSPGGTTAAALRELDERGLKAAFLAAAEAAARRSRELGG